MIWVTTSDYRSMSQKRLNKVTSVKAQELIISFFMQVEPWDIMPYDRALVKLVLGVILLKNRQRLQSLPELNLLALGAIVFTEQDTWFPKGTFTNDSNLYGYTPAQRASLWASSLIVIQFVTSVDMNQAQLDAALTMAMEFDPSALDYYVTSRLNDIKQIVLLRGI